MRRSRVRRKKAEDRRHLRDLCERMSSVFSAPDFSLLSAAVAIRDGAPLPTDDLKTLYQDDVTPGLNKHLKGPSKT